MSQLSDFTNRLAENPKLVGTVFFLLVLLTEGGTEATACCAKAGP